MPLLLTWEADFAAGHADLDAQHRALLGHCNRLADAGDDAAFATALAGFQAAVRAHLDAEAALLAAGGDDEGLLADLAAEREDFEALAGEVATPEHFDRDEIQRFLALWCVGHLRAMAEPGAAA